MCASWPMKPAPTKPIRTFATRGLPVGDCAAWMLEDRQLVRREAAIVDLCHRGDRACLEHATAVREVGLEERRSVELEHLAERPLREQPLAGRDRDRGCARELDRHRRCETAVRVEGDLDVLADRVAQRLDALSGAPEDPVALHGPNG